MDYYDGADFRFCLLSLRFVLRRQQKLSPNGFWKDFVIRQLLLLNLRMQSSALPQKQSVQSI